MGSITTRALARRRLAAAGLIAFAAVAISVGTTNADDAAAPSGPSTGADIYRDCHLSTASGDVAVMRTANCFGFIEGAASMARLYSIALKLDDVCPPRGTTIQQIADVVLGFIAANPNARDAPAAAAVYASLRDAFPCAQSQP